MHEAGRWVEVGERVFVRRCAELDLSLGLIVGRDACLVVDTGTDERQGAELAAEIRAITAAPWTVVLTHAHFDHVLGTSAFLPAPVWAQERARSLLVAGADLGRAAFVAEHRAHGRDAAADALAAARVVAPDHWVTRSAEVDLGGRIVRLLHPGFGHTDHDLLVSVPDIGLVFAGDLVEHDADSGSLSAESFGPDTHLAAWPDALTGLLAIDPDIVVPGHGSPVDREFVVSQRTNLRALIELRARLRRRELAVTQAIRLSTLPEGVTAAALATVD